MLILMARSRTRRRWSLVRPAIGPRTLIAHWRSISAVNSRGLAWVLQPELLKRVAVEVFHSDCHRCLPFDGWGEAVGASTASVEGQSKPRMKNRMMN